MNIEEIIFENKNIFQKLPELLPYLDLWELSKQYSFMRNIGKQAVIDCLNSLNDNHLKIISDYFKTTVTIDKFDNRLVKNVEFKLEDFKDFDGFDEFSNIALYRTKEHCYVSFWR